MSPQKKLMLRRNALFRQQLCKPEPDCQFGQYQTLLQSSSLALEHQHEATGRDNPAAAFSLPKQPPAEH